MLEVAASYFNMSDASIRREIVGAHQTVVDVLKSKGVNYADLRNALVPQRQRLEAAFVFDTLRIDSGAYGLKVGEAIVPLLSRQARMSVLVGDLILEDQDLAFKLLQQHLVLHKPIDIHHTSQLYGIYLNNLSQPMFEKLHQGLLRQEAYVGYLPTARASKMKDWLSFTLGNNYIKSGNGFLCGQKTTGLTKRT